MYFNTRTAMLRGLELRKKLGSWEAVERLGEPIRETIDAFRSADDGQLSQEDVRPAE